VRRPYERVRGAGAAARAGAGAQPGQPGRLVPCRGRCRSPGGGHRNGREPNRTGDEDAEAMADRGACGGCDAPPERVGFQVSAPAAGSDPSEWDQQTRSCPSTLGGDQGRLAIAAGGGADRRSAKNADGPMNQTREAHPLRPSAPLRASELHQYPRLPTPGVRTPARRERRGGRGLRAGPGKAAARWAGQGCGACQRSSTRRRRVHHPATGRGRRAGQPGGPSSANGCAAGPAPPRGAGHSRLTAGHRAMPAPPRPRRASQQPGRGEEASSPRTPLLGTTGSSPASSRQAGRPAGAAARDVAAMCCQAGWSSGVFTSAGAWPSVVGTWRRRMVRTPPQASSTPATTSSSTR
jgi:hypothetical protein